MRTRIPRSRPSVAALEAEIARLKYRERCRMLMKSALFTASTLTAAAVLAVTLWFPILQIDGSSMSPTLYSGDIMLCVKTKELEAGDITAFYHNNKILVKRVIGQSGDLVDLDGDGTVSINGIRLSEPYIETTALGHTDICLPCQVPQDSYFVMGDSRATSLDSRSETIGCVPDTRILGKVLLRIWPLQRFGIPALEGCQ